MPSLSLDHYEYRNYFKLFMLWLKKLEDNYVEYLPIFINKMTYSEIVIFFVNSSQ